jgi:nucleoside-diphosphate-sugar epimerase
MNSEREVVLVTGASGRIGTAAVMNLAGSYSVDGFDRAAPPVPPAVTDHIIDCDLTSDESVRDALKTLRDKHALRLASVIHLAAYYDFAGEPSSLYENLTVRGTRRLLRGLHEFGFEVGQFIFSSTMLVHAPTQPGKPINEDWPLEPKWDYPQSKVETENLIGAERGDIPAVILRMAGVYDDRCHSIPLAHQMQRIYEKRVTSRFFPGDITHGSSFLHMDDLVNALQSCIERRAQLPPETVLLLGETETLSYDELQRSFGKLLHGPETEWETHVIPKLVAKTGAWVQDTPPYETITGEEPFIKPWMIDIADDHYELDIASARDLLGWQPEHSLRETLPKMAGALKNDPACWYRENDIKAPSWVGGGQCTAFCEEECHGD